MDAPGITRRNLFASVGALASSGIVQAAHPFLNLSSDFAFAPGLAYLNTGSLGATPRVVMEKAMAAWKEIELSPTFYAYGPYEEAMETVRGKAAGLLGCKQEEIVLTTSTTNGMNSVALAMGLKAGDRVLTTDQEHPGGRVCWDYMERTHGVKLDIVPIAPGESDAKAIVERFANAIRPGTKVVMFSHLLSSTGLRMPVKDLTALARAQNCISIVDGAQAVGGIQANVRELGCDVYVASGHKWLLGPPGTGLLYLREGLGGKVDPICLQAGRKVYSDSSGVCNIPGVIGLGAAIDYISARGIEKIEAHNLRLREKLHVLLKEVPKVQIVSPLSGPLTSPLLTYKLPDSVESRPLQITLLQKHKIAVKVVPKNWFNGQRISTHLYNTENELERLIVALKDEL